MIAATWRIAWRNLWRNRRRNLATLAAIAFGYMGLVLLGGYAVRVEHFLRTNAVYLQHAGHVAIWQKDGLDRASAEPVAYQLDPAAQAAILQWAKGDPRVERAGAYLLGVGMAGNACTTQPAMLLGVDPPLLQALLDHPEVKEASPELATTAQGTWLAAHPEVPTPIAVAAGLQTVLQKPKVLDQTKGQPPAPAVLACDTPAMATQLAADADIQLIGQTYDGMLSALDGQMVGTFHAPEQTAEDAQIVMPLAKLRELLATDRASYVALFLHNASDAPAVAADLGRALQAKGRKVDTYTYTDETWSPYYVGTMAFLGSMVGFITMLVSVVLVFTVAGAMTLTILERTREIGTWRALGFERRFVLGLLLREALLLSLVGLGIGLVLGLVGAAAINAGGFRFAPPGVAGTIAFLIKPAAWSCALQAALMPPGVLLATWWVSRSQLRKSPVTLLTAPTA
ncbi:MAG: FtsX-like permease family protein [Deltaproteobacteria bacterium]|nr:FtsX-like permease family protein [Deltaproteobacteria bacterium]